MTESRARVAGSRLATTTSPAGQWRDAADRCASEAGPFPAPLVDAWRLEIDAVEARVSALGFATHYLPGRISGCAPGVHALVALSSAWCGTLWVAGQLVDVAAAVELAYRATCHHDQVHDEVRDHCAGSPSREENRRHVLDGDWSITQAAVLAADVGPQAYRLLVRGYGAAQLARLAMIATPALLSAAAALGTLVAGADRVGSTERANCADRVFAWACSLLPVPATAPLVSLPLRAVP